MPLKESIYLAERIKLLKGEKSSPCKSCIPNWTYMPIRKKKIITIWMLWILWKYREKGKIKYCKNISHTERTANMS
jgi:hypothetical protein